MKRFLKWLAIIILFLVVVLIIGKNRIIEAAFIYRARAATGIDLEIGSLNVGLLSGEVEITDLVFKNPPGFGGGDMFNIPLVVVNLGLQELLKGETCFQELDFYLKELTIVVNRKGELNTGAFRILGTPEKTKEEKKRKARKFLVELLKLKIDTATFIDLRTGKKVVYELDIDEVFRDIKDDWSVDEAALSVITAIEDNPRHSDGLDDLSFARRMDPLSEEGLSGTLGPVGKDLADFFERVFRVR